VLLPNVSLLTGPDVYFSLPYLNCSTIRLQLGRKEEDLKWEEILS